MKTKILLTGVGGSIGVHTLCHILSNTNWDVIGTDSFRHKGITDRVTQILDDHPEWKSRVKIITHDLTAPFSPILIDKIGTIDFVISMASRSDVEESIQNPVEFIRDNVAIATNVLEYARTAKPRAFIQISTDEVYGPSGENQGHKEWSSILPSNPYAASKASQEAIAISYWRTYGVPVIITNTMNNFGEMQQPLKFSALVQRMVQAGKTVTIHGSKTKMGSRFYLHSRNFADALLFILTNTKPYMHKDGETDKPDRYNIVGDKRIYNLEFAQIIASLMGKKLKYKLVDFHKSRPGHDRHYGLDGAKLKKLGWKSPVPFEKSLSNTINWTQEHKNWL
jgi:dTDP-glucose 4,6-dehydratase